MILPHTAFVIKNKKKIVEIKSLDLKRDGWNIEKRKRKNHFFLVRTTTNIHDQQRSTRSKKNQPPLPLPLQMYQETLQSLNSK